MKLILYESILSPKKEETLPIMIGFFQNYLCFLDGHHQEPAKGCVINLQLFGHFLLHQQDLLPIRPIEFKGGAGTVCESGQFKVCDDPFCCCRLDEDLDTGSVIDRVNKPSAAAISQLYTPAAGTVISPNPFAWSPCRNSRSPWAKCSFSSSFIERTASLNLGFSKTDTKDDWLATLIIDSTMVAAL